jgi:RNAse (barnase) inhibitor barstar
MNLFEFSSGFPGQSTEEVVVVQVPAGLDTKSQLMRFLASSLTFPAYFGHNWDALDECLADLSWLSAKKVVLWHQDVPLRPNQNERRRYLKILDGIVREGAQIPLKVVFRNECRSEVEAAFR